LQQWRRSLQRSATSQSTKWRTWKRKAFGVLGYAPGDGNCKRKLFKQCGLCKLAQDGKMAMSEVTALKSAIETMATEMV
jgi:hypothetical protein